MKIKSKLISIFILLLIIMGVASESLVENSESTAEHIKEVKNTIFEEEVISAEEGTLYIQSLSEERNKEKSYGLLYFVLTGGTIVFTIANVIAFKYAEKLARKFWSLMFSITYGTIFTIIPF
jgi:uncharacterized BrkB/YihY/UPF0761 family membrane protein